MLTVLNDPAAGRSHSIRFGPSAYGVERAEGYLSTRGFDLHRHDTYEIGVEPCRGSQPWCHALAARRTLDESRGKFANECLRLVAQPSMPVNHLLSSTHQDSQFFSEGSGIPGAALLKARGGSGCASSSRAIASASTTSLLPRPDRGGHRSAVRVGHTSRTSAPAFVRAGASLRPRWLLPWIVQVASGDTAVAQHRSVLRLLADSVPFQCPSTPPRPSKATALRTCLCGSTPMIAATSWLPRDARMEGTCRLTQKPTLP
jgi:hypothetical protein